MKITLEISMYPLSEDYETKILQFISELDAYNGLEYRVNALSTQIQGDADQCFAFLESNIGKYFSAGERAAFVVKFLPGDISLDYPG